MNPGKMIFIVGPTAVGKTDVALEAARRCDGEIISCDSMQVYRRISIASSKPSPAARKQVRHHLIDVIRVDEEFDVSTFNQMALKAINAVLGKNKIPVITGGSGLYMRVLLDGIFEEGGRNPQQRQELEQRAQEEGNAVLYEELKRVDPHAAAKIHVHNRRRIVRALEVYGQAQRPISQLQKACCGLWGKYDIAVFALNRERRELYDRINQRVEEMFSMGLVDEIKKLNGVQLSSTVQQGIGIKEVKGYLNEDYDLDRAKYLMKRNTRHFAKRQLTWFRKDKRLQWIMIAEHDTPQEIVRRLVESI